ncbi:MAG: rhamnulokinase family protein [Oscillospiraceae bacterium]|nr:rhamnulokinase family protein [Oscillospiraceae bacterium]
MKTVKVLAFDFGASSGRAVVAEFDGEKIVLNEIHRFSNDPVQLGDTLFWDTPRQIFEIKQGLMKLASSGIETDSLGIDTWGVDFGLIGEDGRMLENPVHYRDRRTSGMKDELFKIITREKIYELTGIQFMEINTIYQLFALVKKRPALISRAKRLLLIPDLFNYFLTGIMNTELSMASTTQLLDANKKEYSPEILNALGISAELFPPVTDCGFILGGISDDVAAEVGLKGKKIKVISVAAHDTQSAVISVPAAESGFAYISSGTWSLIGTELVAPLINETTLAYNFTNELSACGTVNFLKNVTGLWLIQESRRAWRREGSEYSYSQLENLALKAEPFVSFIDPDDPAFATPGDIPGRVREFCSRTGQHIPETTGDIMRCIYESLALKYRYVLENLESCTGKRFEKLYVVGGGTKDTLLCAMTASACGIPVLSGPTEATVYGNTVIQLIALGKISSLTEARGVIARSEPIKEYYPESHIEWNSAYEKAKEIYIINSAIK